MAHARWWARAVSGNPAQERPGAGSQPGSPTVRVRLAPGWGSGAGVVAVVVGLGMLMLGRAVGTGSEAGRRAPVSAPVREPVTVASARSVAPAAPLIAKAWLARGADGTWLTGRTGRPTRLAAHEIGLAVANGWLVTADERSYGRSIGWRRVDGSGGRTASIEVVPASVAVAGSTAYVSGFDRRTSGDPGLFGLGLADGTVSRLIAPSIGTHPRSVVVAPDGSRVVSATCNDDEACALTSLSTGATAPLATVSAPGYLRAATSSVAIVGPDPATWIAGVDLASGRELWRHEALEMWGGYTTADGRIVQAELRKTADGPRFAVEVIAAQTGTSSTAFTSDVGHGIGLWPELSSDDRFAIGPAFSLEDALAKAKGSAVTVRIFGVADGRELGSVSIDASADR
ncbi:MAG TPA: hypothetical protein VIK65_13360 [Candidatus Limnocylindrales bacterium]